MKTTMASHLNIMSLVHNLQHISTHRRKTVCVPEVDISMVTDTRNMDRLSRFNGCKAKINTKV